jgi:hypothetical protein
VRTSAIQILRYRAEILHLARALAPAGIPLLALKGIHLATAVYPQLALREMNDIDVLVRSEHLDAVAAGLQGLGFSALHDTDAEAATRVRHHLPRFVKSGVGVEVHWRLAPEGQVPLVAPEELWQRAQPSAIAPHMVQLCPEDALLHVSAHATVSHFFELGIRPLCDIRALIDRHGTTIDWDAVADRATAWQCERGLLLALGLTRLLLGTDVPELVFDRLRHARPSDEMLHLAADVMFAQPSTVVTESAGRLMAVPSLGGRVRYAWSRVALSRDQLAVMYPATGRMHPMARWLLPLRRLGHLSQKYAVNLTRLAMTPDSDARRFVDRRNTLAAWLRDE